MILSDRGWVATDRVSLALTRGMSFVYRDDEDRDEGVVDKGKPMPNGCKKGWAFGPCALRSFSSSLRGRLPCGRVTDAAAASPGAGPRSSFPFTPLRAQ